MNKFVYIALLVAFLTACNREIGPSEPVETTTVQRLEVTSVDQETITSIAYINELLGKTLIFPQHWVHIEEEALRSLYLESGEPSQLMIVGATNSADGIYVTAEALNEAIDLTAYVSDFADQLTESGLDINAGENAQATFMGHDFIQIKFTHEEDEKVDFTYLFAIIDNHLVTVTGITRRSEGHISFKEFMDQ